MSKAVFKNIEYTIAEGKVDRITDFLSKKNGPEGDVCTFLDAEYTISEDDTEEVQGWLTGYSVVFNTVADKDDAPDNIEPTGESETKE